jgi:ABC-type lipoprotein export system ATPase subunit
MPELPSIVVRDLVKTFRLPGSAAVDQETREVILHHLLIEAKTAGKIVMVATHDDGLVPRFDRVERLRKSQTNPLMVAREDD